MEQELQSLTLEHGYGKLPLDESILVPTRFPQLPNSAVLVQVENPVNRMGEVEQRGAPASAGPGSASAAAHDERLLQDQLNGAVATISEATRCIMEMDRISSGSGAGPLKNALEPAMKEQESSAKKNNAYR